jgi:hypothetical protein
VPAPCASTRCEQGSSFDPDEIHDNTFNGGCGGTTAADAEASRSANENASSIADESETTCSITLTHVVGTRKLQQSTSARIHLKERMQRSFTEVLGRHGDRYARFSTAGRRGSRRHHQNRVTRHGCDDVGRRGHICAVWIVVWHIVIHFCSL